MNKTGGMFHISLSRDGHDQPWGFRLQGGTDHSRPLQVQRVCIGSPSEGNLQRGDTILKIGGQDTSKLTHQDAHDIIKHAGNVLHLTLQRTGADTLLPTTPSPLPDLSLLITEASHHVAPPLPSPTPSGLPYHTVLQHPVDFLPVSKPLPSPKPALSPREPPPEVDEQKEKEAIHQQPYRTTPLITPSLKTKKDVPVGSYLKFQPKGIGITAGHMDEVMKERNEYTFSSGTGWKNVPIEVLDSVTSAASGQAYQGTGGAQQQPLSRLQPMVIAPPAPDQPPIVQHPSPLPLAHDSQKEVLNLQYNSPMALYSQDNVAQTMKEQTGLTPKQVVFKGVSNKKAAPPPKKKSEPRATKVYSPSKSYTFNAVADEEWGNLQNTTFNEKRPPAPKIKTAPTHQKPGGMGMATEKIAQSQTFLRLMHEVGI